MRSFPLCSLFFVSTALGWVPTAALAQTKDGAVLGGVAGAVIGGIIGHQNDETPEGALIGGAVGAITGGMIGNHREQSQRLQYYERQYSQPYTYHHHHYPTYVYSTPTYTTHTYTQVRPAPTPVRRGVTVGEVIMMTRSGVSETVIANQIQTMGIVCQPNIDDVLAMTDAGVSDFVITTMQTAPIAGTVAVAPRSTGSSVIVREEYRTSMPIDRRVPTTARPASPGTAPLQPVPAYRKSF